MIARFFEWLQRWLDKRDAEAYDKGWQWAAGLLLQGKTVKEIKDHIEGYAFLNGQAHPHDEGVMDAIASWERRVSTSDKLVGL